ncbi:MAG: DUF2142 domain-containing protein [Methylococcus sp.]|nr:DUF2142 domain-containing protein [Methylococcus sp.]
MFADRLVLAYCFLVVFFGLGMIAVMPPCSIPDEPAHFARVYEIAGGQFVGKATAVNTDGGELYGQVCRLVKRPVYDPVALRRKVADMFGAEGQKDSPLGAGATYPPLPFLASALVVKLMEWFGAGIGWSIYGVKLANFAVSTTLTAYALHIIPTGRWVLFWIALLPMTLQQATSVSPDSLTNALSFLWLAVVTQAIFKPGLLSRAEKLRFFSTAGLMAITKFGYQPLLLLFFLIPADRFGPRRVYFAVASAMVAIGMLVIGLWVASDGPALLLGTGEGAPQQLQITWLRSQPWYYFLGVVAESLRQQWLTLAERTLGVMGWLDTPLPRTVYLVMLLGGVFSLVLTRPMPGRWGGLIRTGFFAVTGMTALMIMLYFYIIWTPPKSVQFDGVQGRYLIPLLLPLGVALGIPLLRYDRWHLLKAGVLLCSVSGLSNAVGYAYERYWLIRSADRVVVPETAGNYLTLGLRAYLPVNQPFVCPVDELKGVSLAFRNRGQLGGGSISIHLYDEKGLEIAAWSLPKLLLRDRTYEYFSLEGAAIANCKGRNLNLSISNESVNNANAVGLVMTQANYYDAPGKPPGAPRVLLAFNARPPY